jgi:hypothetical protein
MTPPKVNLDGLGRDEREEVLALYEDFLVAQAEEYLLHCETFGSEG